MKTCPYCGNEYPEEVTVCAIDGQALTASLPERKKLTGVWRGAYGYEDGKGHGGKIVQFTLKLKQRWLGHLTGTVTEDAPLGIPGTGVINGYFNSPTIEFTKKMPIGYVTRADGSRISLREYFIEHGHVCDKDLPSPPISYTGTFLDCDRMQGCWEIRPRRISLPDGWGMSMRQASGVWCAEFSASDLNENPTNAPKEPFFDKTLLPEQDVFAEAKFPLRRLGKFRVSDAEEYLKRFEQENIRFKINRDDTAIRQMSPADAFLGGFAGMAPMIEIFVHPDDEEKAAYIISEDDKV